MRRIFVLLLLAFAAGLATAEDEAGKRKRPPPEPGIHWDADLGDGLARAAREGRPVLLCVNALENEGANIRLATDLYRSAAWGQATRGYVAFVGNPNEHDGPDGYSTRYPGTRSATAQAVLRYVMGRFGSELISPQHVILEPDGDVAFRKEYYEGVVGPALLDLWLSRVSPPVAYARASIDREAKIGAMLAAAGEARADATAKWLASNDGLAVVGILNVLDEERDPARRLALITSLEHASVFQVPALSYGAEEHIAYPEDEPAETLAWLRVLFAADRTTGIVAAARVIARSEQVPQRDAVLRIWAGRPAGSNVPGVSDLSPIEQVRAAEALMLAGDPRGAKAIVPEPNGPLWPRYQRALVIAGAETRVWPPLAEGLADPRPGARYGALLDADAGDVRLHRDRLGELLRSSPHARLRVAAALALLRLEAPREREVGLVLARAAFDPIEGPDTQREAVSRLGFDPGASPEAWMAAVVGEGDDR